MSQLPSCLNEDFLSKNEYMEKYKTTQMKTFHLLSYYIKNNTFTRLFEDREKFLIDRYYVYPKFDIPNLTKEQIESFYHDMKNYITVNTQFAVKFYINIKNEVTIVVYFKGEKCNYITDEVEYKLSNISNLSHDSTLELKTSSDSIVLDNNALSEKKQLEVENLTVENILNNMFYAIDNDMRNTHNLVNNKYTKYSLRREINDLNMSSLIRVFTAVKSYMQNRTDYKIRIFKHLLVDDEIVFPDEQASDITYMIVIQFKDEDTIYQTTDDEIL